MLTTDQKADLLFKKYLGVGSAGTASQYFNEPKKGRPTVLPSQIWAEYDKIPTPAAPVAGVVQKVNDLGLIPMEPIMGSTFHNAFYHPQLSGSIPFNFDINGSYYPTCSRNDGSPIYPQENDYFIDSEAGMLTFYGGLPSGVSVSAPPTVSFWKYIGATGSSGGGGGSFTGTFIDFLSGQIETPTIDNVYYLVTKNPAVITITTMSLALYSGQGTASLKVDNIPIGGISNISLIPTETTYTASVPPGTTIPVGSTMTLELNDMSVGAGRLYFSISMIRTLMS